MRLPLALTSLLAPGPHRTKLDDHQYVEYEDEAQRSQEAKYEGVEGESSLLVDDVSFGGVHGPEYVAALSAVPPGDGGGVEEDRQHQDGGEKPR